MAKVLIEGFVGTKRRIKGKDGRSDSTVVTVVDGDGRFESFINDDALADKFIPGQMVRVGGRLANDMQGKPKVFFEAVEPHVPNQNGATEKSEKGK